MAGLRKARVVKLSRPEPEPTLGPGLHAGQLDRAEGDGYRVVILGGPTITARAAGEVSPELLEECLRERRTVLVSAGARGPVILGALQTAPTVTRGEGAPLRIDAAEIDLRAAEAFTVRVGSAALRIDADGTVRVAGKRMTLDMAALVRVLAAKVELP